MGPSSSERERAPTQWVACRSWERSVRTSLVLCGDFGGQATARRTVDDIMTAPDLPGSARPGDRTPRLDILGDAFGIVSSLDGMPRLSVKALRRAFSLVASRANPLPCRARCNSSRVSSTDSSRR